MKKILITLVLQLFISLLVVNAQDSWQWAKTEGLGTPGENGSHDIATDKDGNIYIVGRFKGDVFTIGDIELTNTQSSTHDVFFAKYDNDGNIIFAKSFGGTKDEHAYSIAIDDDQNIFLTGHFDGTNMQIEETILVNGGVNDSPDMFVVKFDSDGKPVWSAIAAGAGHEYGRNITIDKDGNPIICGDFASTSVMLEGTQLKSNGSSDLFVAKFTTNGVLTWAKTAGGTNGEQLSDIETDSQGNIYIAGGFASPSLTFAENTINNSGSNLDILMLKYDKDGNEIWAKTVEATNLNEANAIAIDKDDNVYFGGYFMEFNNFNFNTITLTNTGIATAFVVKYNSAGIEQWAKSFGGDGFTTLSHISVNADSQLYITGEYNDTQIVFDSEKTITNAGKYDIYIAKFNENGTNLWAQTIGGSEHDYASASCSNKCGQFYITGQFSSTDITFDTHTINNSNSPNTQMYIAKFAYAIEIDGTVINETNDNDGAINITITSGSGDYSFAWTPNNETIEDLTEIAAGTYTVVVTDNVTGCTQTANFEVKEPPCENKQFNIWYFGENAGLDFNTSPPTVLFNGQINSNEGCATIADTDGNLLFYTDGVAVYDRNHLFMPNGIGLLGNNSSTQAALIVPKPGDNNLYYIFTVDAAENNGANGLRYSIVDMSLNSGNGDVTVKNSLIHSPASEKLTITKHTNEIDYWIIAHEENSNKFLASLLTSSGLSTPVESNVGQSVSGNGLWGQMKASPSGDKIACIHSLYGLELFDFDKQTGILTHNFTEEYTDYYGVEFSPNERFLFATNVSNGLNRLVQFDLDAGNSTDIINSKILFPVTSTTAYSLQLSPDAKIYAAMLNSEYIGVIENPNSLGLASNFDTQGVHLSGNLSTVGLPNIVLPQKADYNFTNLCETDETQFTLLDNQTDIQTINWEFTDPIATSEDNNPTHTFDAAGDYNVQMHITSNCFDDYTVEKTVTINPKPEIAGVITDDTGSGDGEIDITITAGSGDYSYLWSPNNETTEDLTELTAGTYTVTVTDNNTNCTQTETFEIQGKEPCGMGNYANNWYFGANAGITFNTPTGEPEALTGGAMFAAEGVSSISDENGNLLFYTNGIDVWNKEHQTMPNGTGLSGDNSSTQSSLIVKQPNSENIFYLFTTDAYSGPDGLQYSIIDMNLEGGKGDITIKNQQLINRVAEKLSATLHSDGSSIWILAQKYETADFYAYLLNDTELNTTPVISTIGTVISSQTQTMGQMRFSSAGTQFACAVHNSSPVSLLEVFKFNNSTGDVFEAINLGNDYTKMYGVEFSPSGRYLYAAQSTGNLYQFDMLAGTESDIKNSKQILGNGVASLHIGPNGKIYGARPDDNFLCVIENPDKAGTSCGFINDGVSLSGDICANGLNNIAGFYFAKASFSAENLCIGSETEFTLISNGTEINQISWDFDDGNTSSDMNPINTFTTTGSYTVTITVGEQCPYTIEKEIEIKESPIIYLGDDIEICENETVILDAGSGFETYLWAIDNSEEQTLEVTETGTYTVTVTNENDCSNSDEIILTNYPVANMDFSGVENKYCQSCIWGGETYPQTLLPTTEGGIFFINGESLTEYLFYLCGDAGEVAQLGNNTILYQLTDDNKCTYTNEIDFILSKKPEIELGNDIEICENETVILDAGSGFETYLWAIDNSEEQTLEVTETGTYTVTVTNENDCSNSDEIHVAINPSPAIDLGEDIELCENETVILDAGSGFETYLWSDNSIEQTINITKSGTYSVTITNENDCSNSDEINITISTIPNISLGEDVEICEGNSITLSLEGNYNQYLWNNDSENAEITVSESGEFWVQVGGQTCFDRDTINVEMILLPKSNLNDTIFCDGYSLKIGVDSLYDSYLWNTGDTINKIEITQDGEYSVEVTVAQCKLLLSCEISYYDICPKDIFIPNGITPDGDGINDTWILEGFTNFEVYIYNRWGSKIYYSNNYSNDWNGGENPAGAYFYVIKLENGTILKGDLNILK